MRTITKIAVCLALVGMLFASCTKETVVSSDGSQQVVINIAPGTRSDGASEEELGDYSAIGSFRVLGYRTDNGRLAFNELVAEWSTDKNIVSETHRISVKEGNYSMVFIANEHLDASLAGILNDDSQIRTIYALGQKWFGHESFLTSSRYIPMVTRVDQVSILGDHEATVGGVPAMTGSGDAATWPVSMKRLGAKVRLHLFVDDTDPIKAENLTYYYNNIPTRVFLLPETANNDYLGNDPDRYKGTVKSLTTVPTYVTNQSSKPAGHIYYGETSEGSKSNVIILPESWFTDAADPENGVLLSVTDGTVTRSGRLPYAANNFRLPRNAFLNVVATVRKPAPLQADIVFTVETVNWNDNTFDDIEIF